MPTTTNNQGLAVPVDSDDPNIPEDMLNLAVSIEKRLFAVFATNSERNTKVPTPEHGQVAYVKADDSFWIANSSGSWERVWLRIGGSDFPVISSGTAAPTGGSNGDVYFQV